MAIKTLITLAPGIQSNKYYRIIQTQPHPNSDIHPVECRQYVRGQNAGRPNDE
jgi:hypothetical protein